MVSTYEDVQLSMTRLARQALRDDFGSVEVHMPRDSRGAAIGDPVVRATWRGEAVEFATWQDYTDYRHKHGIPLTY